MKKERISVQLGKVTKDSITKIAELEGISISQCAAKAIKNFIIYYKRDVYPYRKFKGDEK